MKRDYRKLIDLTIDLVFAENCKKETVSYYDEDRLVCRDLGKLKNELKKKLNEVLTRIPDKEEEDKEFAKEIYKFIGW